MDRIYFFASDIHGSALYTEKMLSAFEESGAEKLILLGDLLYHGPRNALPEDYDTMTVCSMLNSYRDRIIAVRGNCDAEIDQMVLGFPMMADYSWLELNGRSFFATHGHLYNDSAEGLPPLIHDGGCLIHGHTHLPKAERRALADGKGSYFLLNPGSVSIPKGGNPNSYAILKGRSFRVLDFDKNEIKSVEL